MPDMNTTPSQPQKKRWGLRFSFTFAAIAAILAFSTYWLAKDDHQQRRDVQQLQGQLNAAQATVSQQAANLGAVADVVAAPDSVSITLQQQPGEPPGQAHVLYNARIGLAVYSGQISAPPAGKCYQLWIVPSSGAPVSAGLVAANQTNGAVVVHIGLGFSPKEFSVTLEPQGGSQQPTGPKVLLGAVNG